MDSDLFFEELAAMTDSLESDDTQAPPRVKSRIYSALVAHLADTGPLKSLSETASAGRSLCIFEAALRKVPVGEPVASMNACRVCHARYLAENFESPPIFWPHCPYAQFHRGSSHSLH